MHGEPKTWLVLTRPALDGFNPTRDKEYKETRPDSQRSGHVTNI